MKTGFMKYIGILFISVLVLSCNTQTEEVVERETSYYLHRAGYDPVYGRVTFTELAPGKVRVDIQLQNTDERFDFPAHIHFGSINEVGELAFQLNDVDGKTGRSVTVLDQETLSNGDIFNYDHLETLNGSVKIHMSADFFKHIVLCYGNVGANENYITDGVAICTGH
jgi:hypothetical protein